MIIDNTQQTSSSFLSESKDMKLIVGKIMRNNNLKKLLFYNNKDCLGMPNLSKEQTLKVMRDSVRIAPKLELGGEIKSYIIVTFDNYMPSGNPEFRDNTISFDIITHMSCWDLGDYSTRSKRIAGEIDGMLNNQRLTGIGLLEFIGGNQIILNDELAGFSLNYLATHGKEDTIK